jgi:hypothetical protein
LFDRPTSLIAIERHHETKQKKTDGPEKEGRKIEGRKVTDERTVYRR